MAPSAQASLGRLRRISARRWSTTVELLFHDGDRSLVEEIMLDELRRCEVATSRFDATSELSLVNEHLGSTQLSDDLIDYLHAAHYGVQLSGGLVDPTIGGTLLALGYDVDFADLHPRHGVALPAPTSWAGSVHLDHGARTVTTAPGTVLDLGATSKARCADRVATRVVSSGAAAGVAVSLGGDVAMSGRPPAHGWHVAIVEDATVQAPLDEATTPSDAEDAIVVLGGGVATSSTVGRTWLVDDQVVHHLIDPRTGRPANSPWAIVSVHASTCLEANVAATAAHLEGEAAPERLADRGLGARLRRHDGSVIGVGTWPRSPA